VLKAIFFDLDETLITRAAAIRAFIADQYRRYKEQLGNVTEAAYAERFLDIEDNGRIGKHLVYPALVKELGITAVSPETLLEDYRAIYPNFAVTNPGALETLKALRQAGFKIGILTNGNVAVQDGKIDVIGIRPLLDAIVISEAVGLKKPDPAIFLLAAEKIGEAAEACLFVGDNPEVDIVGAAGVKMQTIWFRNGEAWPEGLAPRADLDIDGLAEVLPYCGV
jgi:putative hydrolase of the HAD superfamily